MYAAYDSMTKDQLWQTMGLERDELIAAAKAPLSKEGEAQEAMTTKQSAASFVREYDVIKEKTKDMFEWSGQINDSLEDIGPMMIKMTNQNLTVKDRQTGEEFNVVLDNTSEGPSMHGANTRVLRAVLAIDGDTKQMTAKLGNMDFIKTWVQKELLERRERLNNKQ